MSKNHWVVQPSGTAFVAAVHNEQGQTVRVHPIPFQSALDADRAVARLNDREAGITGIPAPIIPEEQARASRQARLAELRAKRGRVVVLDPDQPAPDLDPEGSFG